MSAPMYSPGPNSVGKTVTDSQGVTYRYNGTSWTPISEAPAKPGPTARSTPVQNTNNNTGLATSLTNNVPQQSTSDALIQALIKGGYNPTDAKNAANGPRATELAKEYGVGSDANSSASSSENPLQQINDMISGSFQSLIDQTKEAFTKYQSSNPFNLDQVLAQSLTQAKEQVDPYYNETLSNYLTGVTRQLARSKTDTQNLLGELNAQANSYSRDTQLKLQQSLDSAGQGFADAGLLSSGAAQRGMGQIQVSTGNQLADYLRGNAYQQNVATLGGQRTAEDINLASTMQQRDIARQQYTDEQNTANEIAKTTGQQYVNGFQQTLPAALQANTGFDLLKQLGIPS